MKPVPICGLFFFPILKSYYQKYKYKYQTIKFPSHWKAELSKQQRKH